MRVRRHAGAVDVGMQRMKRARHQEEILHAVNSNYLFEERENKMKNKTLLTICASALVGLSMGATVAMAYTAAGGGIVGSKHDMNQWVANGDPYQRVCAYCHTPHHAIKSDVLDYNPLWAHTLNESVTFSKYQSASLNASITDPLVGPSRLCMSCHDGVIAIDQHYSIDGGMVKTGDNFGNIAVANGQGDLSNDH